MRNPAKHFARGLSLVELMVALVIGALLIAGAVTVFLQSRNTYRANDTVSRMQEAGRYAIDVIAPDVRLAGFWGLTNRPMSWTTTAGPVSKDCGTNWATNVNVPIEGRDGKSTGGSGYDDFAASSKCPASTSPKVVTPSTWSDVLIVRRASADQAALENTRLQVQSNRESLVLFSDGVRPAGYNAAPQSETHNLIADLYYIGETPAVNGVRQYALRRQTLSAGPQMIDTEIMPGIQDMQVQFGLDTNGDGTVERYINPQDAIPVGARIATVMLYLLVVSDEIEVGFSDTNRAYTYANATQTASMFHDNRRRLVVTKTIQIRNSVS